jgi:mono/diheme cytochrome c family protein
MGMGMYLPKLVSVFAGLIGVFLWSAGQGEREPTLCDFPTLRARWSQENCASLDALKDVLPDLWRHVRPYAQTYVLVFPEEPTGSPQSWDDPVLARLRVGFLADPSAEALVARFQFAEVVRYPPSPSDACILFTDLHRGKVDAVLTWAPLAGYWIAITDAENRLRALPIPKRGPTPTWSPSSPRRTSVAEADLLRCADRVQGVLESYGVAPAELLTADLEDLSVIPDQPPPEDPEAVRVGEGLYYRYCDRCHGTQAVRGRWGLELRQRFLQLSYPEFIRIILEGRPGRGMPAYRGLLDRTQAQALYQYLRALTMGKMKPREPSD